jgi:nitrate/TMAO reductase-like tetraheme cytochrome c subunit
MKAACGATATRAMQQLLTIAAALALIMFIAAAEAAAPADALSASDKACLGCHAAEGMTKALANGDALSLHIRADAFAKSVHKLIGCQACHTQVKLPEHPAQTRTADSARAYAIAQAESCRSCHDRVYKTYEGSMHAARLREGNTAAPTCADCHRPHEVTAASVQDGPRNVCLTCHAGAAETHLKWLPNAARHLDAIACSGCHAPDALRKVDLRLHDNRSNERLVDRAGTFEKRARAADANGNGLDAVELRTLIAGLNREGADIGLRGHIELRNGVDAHELPFKATAVRDCISCHREGMAQFKSVTVSALGPDERPLRYDVHGEALHSALSVDALRGFYAIGGTRIKALDVLLGFAFIGGISVPVLHIALRRLLARRRKNGDGK